MLDADFAPQWAAQHGLEGTIARGARDRAEVIEAVQAGIDAANSHLARVEQIKKFTIVRGDWLPGGDELTPTMKLKRKPIAGSTQPRSRRCTRAEDRAHAPGPRAAHAPPAGAAHARRRTYIALNTIVSLKLVPSTW